MNAEQRVKFIRLMNRSVEFYQNAEPRLEYGSFGHAHVVYREKALEEARFHIITLFPSVPEDAEPEDAYNAFKKPVEELISSAENYINQSSGDDATYAQFSVRGYREALTNLQRAVYHASRTGG